MTARRLTTAAAAAALSLATPASAQTWVPPPAAPPPTTPGLPPGETDFAGARTLQGHPFQRPVFVDSAFTAGFFGDTARLGFASTSAGPVDLHSNVLYDSLDFGIPLGRGVQIAFDGNVRAVLGANRESRLVSGESLGLGALPGLRVAVARSQRYGYEVTIHGAATLDYERGIEPSTLIAIFAERVKGNDRRERCLLHLDVACAFPSSTPVKTAISSTTKSLGGLASLGYAQAFGRHFGIQTSAEVSVGGSQYSAIDPLTREKTTSSSVPLVAGAGIAPAVDFAPGAPIGMQVEYAIDYRTSAPAGNNTQAFTNNLAFGVYYTGRRDLQLGLVGTASFRDATTTLAKLGANANLLSNAYSGGSTFLYYF